MRQGRAVPAKLHGDVGRHDCAVCAAVDDGIADAAQGLVRHANRTEALTGALFHDCARSERRPADVEVIEACLPLGHGRYVFDFVEDSEAVALGCDLDTPLQPKARLGYLAFTERRTCRATNADAG